MIKLIKTNSQFNVFNALIKEINCADGLSNKNLVFCEEKISLMVERMICSKFGGTFNTGVYSFGNYLRSKLKTTNLLSKEGASMAVKSVLSKCALKRFNKSRQNLAPSLYNLIIQLKSATVTPEDIEIASQSASGALKDKLIDIAEVYREYQNFLTESGYGDQSLELSLLPEIIERSEELKNTSVYIVGYMGFTVQIRRVISALLKKAKKVTAILTTGDNQFAFVNESAEIFKGLCALQNLSFKEEYIDSDYTVEGKRIVDNLFNPTAYKMGAFKTDVVRKIKPSNAYAEAEQVASIIKEMAQSGRYKYKDMTVCVPNVNDYKECIRSAFSLLEVPYFLDEKKVAISHPLVKLILSYVEVFRKNFQMEALKEFYTNILVCEDKTLSDALQNYTLMYNINYSAIKNEFNLPFEERDIAELEEFRKSIVSHFNKFDVNKLLIDLNVEEKLLKYSEELIGLNEHEESAINSQMFKSITNVLTEIEKILPESFKDINEFKKVFISGVNAIELSIIPQYNDAVFIGGYREASLGKAKNLFAMGLTSSVPELKEDGVLLSDDDIAKLENLRLLVEPKIRIINHRTKESVALALSAFSDNLFFSCPELGVDSKPLVKSEIITYLERLFTVKEVEKPIGYTSIKQGYRTFASDCGEFTEGQLTDFTNASSFYKATDGELASNILDSANKEVKIRINKEQARAITENVTSPTAIEDYCKCPYSAFFRKSLRVNDRKDGRVNRQSVGIFMHEVLKNYVARIGEVSDRESSKILFNNIVLDLMERPEYLSLKGSESDEATMQRVLSECEKFCYKNYEWQTCSSFRTESGDVEVKFGKGGKYPAISLLNGKIKLSGTIDRVDRCEDYYRIIDYKSGGYHDSEKELFSGVGLQLYLYSAVIGDKKLAGAYYLPMSDSYAEADKAEPSLVVGKTLNDTQVLLLQDSEIAQGKKSKYLPVKLTNSEKSNVALSEDELNSYVKYALLVSEKATQNMEDGVIVASPYGNQCSFCQFKAICGYENFQERQVGKITKELINSAVAISESQKVAEKFQPEQLEIQIKEEPKCKN